MAIIESTAIGRARKSVGNITYKTIQGRTIASSRIRVSTSNTPRQAAGRSGFGMMMRLGRSLREVISIGFDPVEHGSRCNNFTQSNVALSRFVAANDLGDWGECPVYMLYRALRDERFTGRVLAAKGGLHCGYEYMVDAGGQMEGSLVLSRDFRVGDEVTVALGMVKAWHRQLAEGVRLYSFVMDEAAIASLSHPQQLIIAGGNHPVLNVNGLFPGPGDVRGLVAAAIVRSGAERTTSVYVVL